MSRLPIVQELQVRKNVEEVIEKNALTEKIIYPTPSSMQVILRTKGIIVSKELVYAAYERMGIKSVFGGLWVKDRE